MTAEEARATAEEEGLELVPSRNVTGYKGVYHVPENCKSRPYVAHAKVNGKCIHLGHFATDVEAAEAYAEHWFCAPMQ